MSLTETISASNKMEYNPGNKMSIVGPEERLKRGIWPRSFPLWVAAFYITLFIIRPWEQLLPWLGAIYFEKLYALCMIAAVFFSGKKKFKMNSQTLTVFLFLLAISFSAIFARHPSLAWDPLYEYLTLIVFYFVLIMVIRTPYELAFMVTCYIVTMAVYLGKSQWEFFVHGQHRYDPGSGIVRMCGIESTFGGPNSLAMSIVVSLPMLIFLWSVRKEFTDTWPNSWKRWFPWFLVFYFLLAASSIILTNSRSGMVSFILFIILIALFRGRGIGRKLAYVLLGFFVLAIIWLAMPQENRNRFRSTWDPSAGTEVAQKDAEGRIVGYKAGITMFERFPLTGVGIGNFIEYRVAYVDGVSLNAHNLAGQVFGETGIVGASTFLLVVVVILINCHKVKNLGRKYRSDQTLVTLSRLGLAIRDAVILLAFEGLFGHNLLRFNWLWLAAFSSLALQFGGGILRQESQKNDYRKAIL